MKRCLISSFALLALGGCGASETETETVTVVDKPAPPLAANQGLGETRAIDLEPLGSGSGNYGRALIRRERGPDQLVIEAFLSPPSTSGEAFEIWLYNGPTDVRSLGAQVSDKSGDFAGRAELPPDWRDYRYIDISREMVDTDLEHSGESVLRGEIDDGSPNEENAIEANAEALSDYVERSGDPELIRNRDTANTIRLGEGYFRNCIARDDRERFFCVFVDTRKDPPKVVMDHSTEPNANTAR